MAAEIGGQMTKEREYEKEEGSMNERGERERALERESVCMCATKTEPMPEVRTEEKRRKEPDLVYLFY